MQREHEYFLKGSGLLTIISWTVWMLLALSLVVSGMLTYSKWLVILLNEGARRGGVLAGILSRVSNKFKNEFFIKI